MSRSLFLALMIGTAYAQRYPITTYTIKDGLIQSTVQAVGEDTLGRIWLGTQQGVCVFDGRRFSYPDRDRQINAVRTIQGDDRGGVWLATDRGLFHSDGTALTIIGFEDGRLPSVWDLAIDERNRVWCATEDGAAVYQDGRLVLLEGLVGEAMRSVFVDADRVLFGGRSELITLDLKSREQVDRLVVGLAIWAVCRRGDELWIGTNQGLLRYHRELQPMGRSLRMGTRAVTSFATDGRGNLWIGTDDGVYFGKPELGSLTRIGMDQGLSHGTVYEIHQDREGCIWFGTEIGASAFPSLAFLQFDRGHELTSDAVWSICEDSKGRVWVGTDRGISVLQNKTAVRHWLVTDGLPSPVVRALVASEGGVWAGTTRGLVRISGESLEPVADFQDRFVRTLWRSRQGQLWVGTDDHGAWLSLDDGESWTRVEGLPSPRIYTISGDNGDQVWLGTEYGLAIWNQGVLTLEHATRLPDPRVLSILAVDRRDYWVGTDSGLARVLGDQVSVIDSSNGLADNVCYFLLPDGDQVWVGTNQGLTRLQGSRSTHFTEIDGLSYREMNVGAALRDSTGALWVGSYRGLTRIDPDLIPHRQQVHFVQLDRLLVYGEPRTTETELVLEHHENYLRFEFSAACTINPQNVTFRSRLEGFDRSWNLGMERSVQYAALSPGDYRFVVEVADHQGQFGGGSASFPFTIQPPFWQAWWFRLLGLIALLGLAYWVVANLKQRNRVLQQEVETERANMMRREAEIRLMHAQMNPHFIQNTLNNAIYFAESDPKKSEQILAWLSRMLRRSFDSTKSGWSRLGAELELTRSYLEIQRVRFEQRLTFELNVGPGLEDFYIPSFTLQPLAENAVVHGFRRSRDAQHVRLVARTIASEVLIDVINPGPPLERSFESYIRDDHALGNINSRLGILCHSGLQYQYSEGLHHVGFRVPTVTNDPS